MQSLRYAVRVLLRSPGFTSIAVISLALGIGANTAVFSVVHAVLLRPLPYVAPDRLVRIGQQVSHGAVTIPEYRFTKENSKSFSSVAGYRGGGDRGLNVQGGVEWVKTLIVTADFFQTLGVTPAIGREIREEEARQGGAQAVVLSDGLWRRSFGGDPNILGHTVTLDNDIFNVVGILPARFWFSPAADAFVALRPTGSLMDTGTNTQMIGRLKPDIDLRTAQAEMGPLTDSYKRATVGRVSREYRGLTVIPFQDWLVGDVRLNLWLLFGAVALLLLIACSNLASLLMTHLAGRSRDIAVRLALGSGKGRLLRQFLMENLMLVVLGCGVGLLCAYVLIHGLVASIPFNLPTSAPIGMNMAVLLFTTAIGLGTGLLFSIVPLATAGRMDVHEALKSAGRSTGSGYVRQRTRAILVVGEVALSVTLLVSAGLLIQSLYNLHHERLGFTNRGLITFETPFSAERRKSITGVLSFESAMLDRLRAIPGVRSVAGINVLPLTGFSNLPTQRQGHAEQSIGGMEIRLVTPAYFEVMGIPLLRGRSFTGSDGTVDPAVAVVNETLARRWWQGASPLGDRVVIGQFQGRVFPQIADQPREVIGVAADTKTAFLKEPAWPTIYIPAAQAPGSIAGSGMTWVIRADLSQGLAEQLRTAVKEIDGRQRIVRMQTMEEIVAATTASSRFDAWLFTLFAGLALLLTTIGIYGLLSFSVEQRRQEIGTRMALGAGRGDILRMVLRTGVGLTAIGLGVGLVGAFVGAKALGSLLHGVRPTDPVSFVVVVFVLLAVGGVGSYMPARRATRIDPMVALRCE